VTVIILPDASDYSSDEIPEILRPNESAEPSASADKKSNWKSTASATAKLFLRGVRDSADAFGPLKSVANGLCFVLENCEVCSSACICCPQCLQEPSEPRQIGKQ
jgi:hypothetical protein